LREFQQGRGEEWFGIDQRAEWTRSKTEILHRLDGKHSARGISIPQRHTNATSGRDGEVIRKGIVKNKLRWAVDENAGKRHVAR
jgi:hypothetical protein